MGQKKKRNQNLSERRQAELEKQKRENRIMWGVIIGVLVGAMLIAVLVAVLPSLLTKKPQMQELENFTTVSEKTNYVRMFVTYTDQNGKLVGGDIVVELRPDIAPITAENFKDLVSRGFYNGLTFHRVYKGFMIQGGDPKGDGTGGSDKTIVGEFAANGITNDLSHERGVISMARSNNMNSASSQFFIMHADNTGLDGNYAAFGKVIYGMETVDGIAQTQVVYNKSGERTLPVNKVEIKQVVFVTPKDAPAN